MTLTFMSLIVTYHVQNQDQICPLKKSWANIYFNSSFCRVINLDSNKKNARLLVVTKIVKFAIYLENLGFLAYYIFVNIGLCSGIISAMKFHMFTNAFWIIQQFMEIVTFSQKICQKWPKIVKIIFYHIDFLKWSFLNILAKFCTSSIKSNKNTLILVKFVKKWQIL